MPDSLSNYRLKLKNCELLPIVSGGMGVDISSSELALEIARLGGVGHISDAMAPCISDRKFATHFQNEKGRQFAAFRGQSIKKGLSWDSNIVKLASIKHVLDTMSKKSGNGMLFINIMEKLSMGASKETLQARLIGAMDGGIDGITLSAGLHTSSLALVEDHPRFRDVIFGIIVSSLRALKIFLRSASRVRRLPDFIVVEGPLAGGHLGFGEDWANYGLVNIVSEIIDFLKKDNLDIPLIPAGGIFTGTDAVNYMKMGASAVQLATRFVITKESGFPEHVKQVYLNSREEDIVVNASSPTGYLMRMLKSSPSLNSNQPPNCEALGYILDADGVCSYISSYEKTPLGEDGRKLPVSDKMCICSHFMKFQCYTCGHTVYRLKDTTVKLADGNYYLPPAEHVFFDYLNSIDHQVTLPTLPLNLGS